MRTGDTRKTGETREGMDTGGDRGDKGDLRRQWGLEVKETGETDT